MKLNVYESDDSLDQIYCRGDQPEFAFVRKDSDGEYTQCHQQAMCKDYANDIIFVNRYPEMSEKMFPVYSFKYDVKKYPLDSDKTRISFNGSRERMENIPDNFQAIVHASMLAGYELPELMWVDEETVIVEADAGWQSSAFNCGIFLVLLRCTTLSIKYNGNINNWLAEILKKYVGPDVGKIRDMFNKATPEWFIKNMSSITEGYELCGNIAGDDKALSKVGKRDFHNHGAFTAISGVIDTDDCPGWGWKLNIEKLTEDFKKFRVFVYGTLKTGHGNHHLLEDSVFVGKRAHFLPFILKDLGPFPIAVPSQSNHTIQGEEYIVDEQTLQRLDRLEGYPDFYNRTTISGAKNYYIYFANSPEKYEDAPTIRNGKWRE